MRLFNQIIKRLFDVVLSGIAIIISCPLLAIIAIMIRMDSEGEVLFRQKRLTKNGKVFVMYKFRTMVVNAEQMGTGLFNYANDSRITRVGAILRSTSLDELPQLFNILKGDMSIVGPRPCVIYELGDFATLNKRYKKRFEVKAGLTGLAQVKGRNNITWDRKVEYDNRYVERFNKIGFLEDIVIIFATIARVFKRENIYETKQDETLTDVQAAEEMEKEVIRLAHLPDE